MSAIRCALFLLCGTVGAGFASGRELVRFFASHGRFAPLAVGAALLALYFITLRLLSRLRNSGASSISGLCRASFGPRFGALCAALLFLLEAVAGGAMLCCCAHLCALLLPLRHAYPLSMALTLLLALLLCRGGCRLVSLSGVPLLLLLPALLLRLLSQPAGEACFAPDALRPVLAAADGVAYAALNLSLLVGALPLMASLSAHEQRRAVRLFCALVAALLVPGVAVCLRHYPTAALQSLPFVALSAPLGRGGYVLLCLAMFSAAFSTLCALASGMRTLLPLRGAWNTVLTGLSALLFALLGFDGLVGSAYPALGALCAGLMALLCLPIGTKK